MKRLILSATAVLFLTLTLWAQTGTPVVTTPAQNTSTEERHHRNRQRNHRHHPRHRTGISARR